MFQLVVYSLHQFLFELNESPIQSEWLVEWIPFDLDVPGLLYARASHYLTEEYLGSQSIVEVSFTAQDVVVVILRTLMRLAQGDQDRSRGPI